jgi:hypothetical protein
MHSAVSRLLLLFIAGGITVDGAEYIGLSLPLKGKQQKFIHAYTVPVLPTMKMLKTKRMGFLRQTNRLSP